MKKFCIRLLLFGFVVCCILTLVILIFSSRLTNPSIYKLDASVEYLIVGDSHTKCALNDSIIPHTLNVSSTADSYLYCYLKIKKLLEYNNNLKGIVLAYSRHNMSKEIDDWNFEDRHLIHKTAEYLPLLGWNEVMFVVKKNPISFLKGVVLFPKIKFNIVRTLNSKSTITHIGVGGFEGFDKQMKDKHRNGSVGKKNEKNMEMEFSESQIYYLNKIVEICRVHKLGLILVSSPLHYSYPRENERLAREYYTKHLAPIKWLNYSSFELPDSCFADLEHINKTGAEIFSKHIREKLDM